jgi:Gas vesicle synthesis protein GvpL/GvpF
MPAQSTAQESGQRRSGQDGSQTGAYVYGIFPSDIKLNNDLTGVGDPPGEMRIVSTDDLAALVSTVRLDGPLGTPQDLTAHQQILDACAVEVPLLPIRFGAVLTDDEAVVSELLDANHDEFLAALRHLEGTAEFVVKGRYDEGAVLGEVLADNREAAELLERIRGADPDATRDLRIRLGEIVNDGVTDRREADTRLLGKRMSGHCVASKIREASHELDAINVAFLLKSGQDDELRDVIDGLAQDWHGRVELRVLGPMAAYDFVVTAEAPGGRLT